LKTTHLTFKMAESLTSVPGLIPVHSFDYRGLQGKMYQVEDPRAIPPHFTNPLMRLAADGLPGIPPADVVKALVGSDKKQVLTLSHGNKVIGTSSFELWPRHPGVNDFEFGYFGATIVWHEARGQGLGGVMRREFIMTHKPPVIASTADHPAIHSDYMRLQKGGLYEVFPRLDTVPPEEAVAMANHIVAARRGVAIIAQQAVDPYLVRRNFYEHNPQGNAFPWGQTKLGQQLGLTPNDGVFVVGFKSKRF
jgi:hypothetical protein